MPNAKDIKVFVPAKDFTQSMKYYTALGWKINWKDEGLAELELANCRFYLQNYYHKGWANNFMMYINVESAQEWFEHISKVLAEDTFKNARVNPPKEEDHAIVTYAWDPSGVLLHFAQ